MLEDTERRRADLLAEELPPDDMPARLARVLERLPEIVRQHLTELETLLAAQQIDKGEAILDALDTKITLHPCGDHLEAEITGKAGRVLLLAASKSRSEVQLRWLGEEDSNPR